MRTIFLCLFALSLITQAKSQIQNSQEIKRPSVILFMLHLSTNKIEGLKNRGMESEIPEVIQADLETNKSIIADFAQHFTFCPVYFFYDSSFYHVKEQQWDKVIFYDYESNLVKKSISATHFEHYYIADVGYPSVPRQLETNDQIHPNMRDSFRGDEDAVSIRNYGINLYDGNFTPLPGKLSFTDISLRMRGPLFGQKKMTFYGAAKFNSILEKRFGK